MASNTPWILRASDPVWREDHDYKKGHRICGSDGAIYIARQDSGPNTAVGVQNPVTETSGDYWISLANSLKSGGANELTGATTAKKLETKIVIGGIEFDGSGDITNYTTCDTQSSASDKAAVIKNFKLVPGACAHIRFTNGNTHTTPTLNISDTGAYEIRVNNEPIKDYYIEKNGTYAVVFDGTYYQIVNGIIGTKTPAAVKLDVERSIQGVKFDGTGDITNYTICDTNANDSNKKVTLPGFKLTPGAIVIVKFSKGSTTTVTTLDVNGTGAKDVKWNDELLKDYFIDTDGIYILVYDGTSYQLVNGGPTKTTPAASELKNSYTINGVEFNGSGNITNYGVCSTAADKAAKTVDIKGFKLSTGASVRVLFTYGNTTTSATLNVSGTGAKALKYNNANVTKDSILAKGTYDIVYDGTCYQMLNSGGAVAAAATKLNQAITINGVKFDGSAAVTAYGVCATAAATAAKVVAITNFSLVKGATVSIRFTYGNTVLAPTLNVNGTGAKVLKYNNGSLKSDYIAANSTYMIVYDGTYYQLVGKQMDGETVVPCTGVNNYYDSIRLGVKTILDSDNVSRTYYPFYNIKKGNGNGHGFMIDTGGALVLAGGDAGRKISSNSMPATGENENLFLASDNSVYVYVGQNDTYDATKRVMFSSNTSSYFPGNVWVRNRDVVKGTKPTANRYASINFCAGKDEASTTASRLGCVETCVTTAGDVQTAMMAYKYTAGNTSYATIGVKYENSGATTTFCPNPVATSDTNNIATTAWVRDRLIVSTGNPSGGNNGDFWFKIK